MSTRRFVRTLLNKFHNDNLPLHKINIHSAGQRFIGLVAKVSEDNENLVVKRNRVIEEFPLVWLRDNCMCENCFHKSSQSRIIYWKDFDVNVKAISIEAKNEDKIEINWHDGHKSSFSWDWLEKRSFRKDNQEKYLNNVYIPSKKTWNKNELLGVMKNYEYKDIIDNDKVLHQWLTDLAVYGVTVIKNVRENEQECRKISQRVAFTRKTHYGEDFYVIAKEGTNNVAYLSNPLQLHTDLPYYDYKPGVILLHCLVQTKGRGGGNLLTDAFHVAEKLRIQNKAVFDILSQTVVNWSDIGEEDGVAFHKIHRAPMISLDEHGNIHRIRHSIPQRDSYFTVNIRDVKRWYNALKIFVDEIYNSAAHFKTLPGDVLAFDNTRLVHGRLGYEDTADVKRLLVGNYLDWDEIYSKLRVLSKRFEN